MVVSEVVKSQIVNNTTPSCPNLTVEDGITYLSCKSSCINFNYVWYSVKLWKITAINPDGTMKMITDDVITNVSYGNDFNFYDTSKKGDTSYTGSYIRRRNKIQSIYDKFIIFSLKKVRKNLTKILV